MRHLPLALIVCLAAAAALARGGGAANECQGIPECISVPGPWVVVPAHGTALFELSCPGGRGVVGGLDAVATSPDVRVSFDGRLGAPVQPGTTTTRSALFRAVSVSARVQAFQPWLGCIPTQGGGGRSTVSARVGPAGPSLVLHSVLVAAAPGSVRTGRVACAPNERFVDAWHSVAFRTRRPPKLSLASLVRARHRVVGREAVVVASAGQALPAGARAAVQVGVECAP